MYNIYIYLWSQKRKDKLWVVGRALSVYYMCVYCFLCRSCSRHLRWSEPKAAVWWGKKRFCGSSTGFPSAPKQPQSSRHAVSKIRYHLCISPWDDFIWFPHVSHLRKLKLWRCVSATVLYPIVSRRNQSCPLRAQVFAKTCSQSLAHGRRLAAQSPMGYRFCVLDKASPNVFWMVMMVMVMQYVIQCVILSPFVTSWLFFLNVLSWYHVVSCHVMSRHTTSRHVTSRYLLFRSVLFLFVYVYSVHMCISTYEYKENMHTAGKKTQPQSGTYYMYIYIWTYDNVHV